MAERSQGRLPGGSDIGTGLRMNQSDAKLKEEEDTRIGDMVDKGTEPEPGNSP